MLITIVLVAFLVLLLVAMATLTRVETQVATNSQSLAQARQNALMALNVAMGELQVAAGPDQRTTAPAALGAGATGVTAASTADNGLTTPSTGSRYWTGVWGNKAAPDAIFSSAPQPVLLRWLVSGNEKAPAISTAADGHITAPAAAAVLSFHPALPVTLADGSALSSGINATTALQVGTTPAALLLGPKTAGTSVANVDSYVAAPLVDISSTGVPGLPGTNRIGRYAWWVGDEGVKAKFNFTDPYTGNTTPDSANTTTSRDSRYRVLASQRNGIERITAFANANYPLATTPSTDPLYIGVGRTLTTQSIRFASPAVSSTALQNHVHDLTTYSYGVLADSQFGGLRRDLTFHLDSRSGDTFLDGRNILPDGPTPLSSFSGSKYTAQPSLFSETVANGGKGFTTLDISPRLGPKWDQVKSFYQTAYDHPVDLEVQPAVDIDVNPVKVQAGISPVIVAVRTLFALNAGPSIDTAVIVLLGNPYTRPLKASSGLNLRLSLPQQAYTNTALDSNTAEMFIRADYQPKRDDPGTFIYLFTRKLTPASTRTYYPILKLAPTPTGDGPTDPDAAHPGLLDRVLFQIPPNILDLAPGEVKAYKVDGGATLPSETINGIAHTVVPLEEMTSSAPATFFNQPCDPHYVSSDPALPPGIYTGAPIPAEALFRVGQGTLSYYELGLNFTLTLPGKPNAVLHRLGSIRQWASLSSAAATMGRGINTIDGPRNIFDPLDGYVSGGSANSRNFLNGTGGNGQYSGESARAVHSEANMIGSLQDIATDSSQGRKTLITNSFKQDTNYTETAFLSGYNPSNATQGAWGQGAPISSTPPPRGKFVVSDVPAARSADEVPLLSLAQLQHLDLSANDRALGVSEQTGMAVGNSRYDRFVSRAASRTDPMANRWSQRFSNTSDNSSTALGDDPRWYRGYVPDLSKNTLIRRYDIAYLLNAALWDGGFFSTVRPAAGSDSTQAPLPANRRLAYLTGSAPTLGQLRGADASAVVTAPAALAPGENGLIPAAHLLVNGAFNINSTSVEAWKAVLSGLRGLGVGSATATSDITPFAHSIRQPGSNQTVLSTSSTTAQAAEATYTGFRSLNDAQITALATQIVAQVRARGPFLSLAQFVNRNLTAAAAPGDPVADTGLAGALQQAIDRTDINASLNKSAGLGRASNAMNSEFPDNAFMPEGDTSGLSSYMAAPGWLSQADLLQVIGSSLSARSDTFIIRTYGEVLDPVNSPAAPAAPVVTGRAWCEAVVQRMPDYVDNSQRPTLAPSIANATNQAFGRRFRVVSFRWLSPDDI